MAHPFRNMPCCYSFSNIQVHYAYCPVSLLYLFTGFLWEVRPLPGILQADSNWMATGSQDRGRHFSDITHANSLFSFLVDKMGLKTHWKYFSLQKSQIWFQSPLGICTISSWLSNLHMYHFHEFCHQVVNNNLNPTWKPFRIPLQSLCGADLEKPIKVPKYIFLPNLLKWVYLNCHVHRDPFSLRGIVFFHCRDIMVALRPLLCCSLRFLKTLLFSTSLMMYTFWTSEALISRGKLFSTVLSKWVTQCVPVFVVIHPAITYWWSR